MLHLLLVSIQVLIPRMTPFDLTQELISFKDQNNSIEVGIDHKEYSHTTKFSEDNIKALSADFN